MKSRPILYSTPMVQAQIAGMKKQTRRMVKNYIQYGCLTGDCPHDLQTDCNKAMRESCSYGQTGDLLYVRETWGRVGFPERNVYRANPADEYQWGSGKPSQGSFRWKPSIHMPRYASRLTNEITSVRVERLHDISAEDAIAEGIWPVRDCEGDVCGYTNYFHTGEGTGYYVDPRDSYQSLWKTINGDQNWDENPWVWVIEFEVHQQNVDEFLKARAA